METPNISQPQVQTEPQTSLEPEKLVKPLSMQKFNKKTLLMVIGSFLVVVLGVVTGWFLAGKGKGAISDKISSEQSSNRSSPNEAGVGSEESYNSNVEGVLKKGGIKGEGTHYIDRDMGEAKYVYLTSSAVDLDSFVDKKVIVWGDTISAKYASWMVDVGKVKVVK